MSTNRVFEELDPAECLALVHTQNVGRVAVVVDDGAPLVVPVNYVTDDETIIFRTGAGSKLSGLRTEPVSFQVDDHDGFRRMGWSVLIRGICYELTEDELVADPQPWAPGERNHWVRLMPMEITGRRISWFDPAFDARGYL